MNNEIIEYIKSNPRNKIVFHRYLMEDMLSLNIGQELAKQINNFPNDSRFTLKAKSKLEEIIINAVFKHNELGNTIAIHNFGILFEPSLKLDFHNFIDNLSKTNSLFIKWDGEFDNENIYFLTKNEGLKVNLKNLSHIHYEI